MKNNSRISKFNAALLLRTNLKADNGQALTICLHNKNTQAAHSNAYRIACRKF